MRELLSEQEAHGCVTEHLLEPIAARIGVRPRSLETRFGQHVRGLVCAYEGPGPDAWRRSIGDAPDFLAAYEQLMGLGVEIDFAIFDRLVWADTGRYELTALRTAERRRRQALAEEAACRICDAAMGVAA